MPQIMKGRGPWVDTPEVPPEGAVPVGNVMYGGRLHQVYRVPRPEHEITHVVPRMLPNGKPDMETTPAGVPFRQRTMRVPLPGLKEEDKFVEVISVDGGNGMRRLERYFRPSENDLAAKEAERYADPAFLAEMLRQQEQKLAELTAEVAKTNERYDGAAKMVMQLTGARSVGEAEMLLDEEERAEERGLLAAAEYQPPRRQRRPRDQQVPAEPTTAEGEE